MSNLQGSGAVTQLKIKFNNTGEWSNESEFAVELFRALLLPGRL